jgi:hypothetical protein
MSSLCSSVKLTSINCVWRLLISSKYSGSCFNCYRNSIKTENDKNRLNSIRNKLKRKNIITPITNEEEIKEEQYNDITTVEIRTVECFV